jgi:hypothetical protein
MLPPAARPETSGATARSAAPAAPVHSRTDEQDADGPAVKAAPPWLDDPPLDAVLLQAEELPRASYLPKKAIRLAYVKARSSSGEG